MRRRDFIRLVGGTAAWPLAARAQQALPVIGVLSSGSQSSVDEPMRALKEGLATSGYVEGQNIQFQYRWGDGEYDRLHLLANDLVERRVNVIVAIAAPAARAAKKATSTIPIVFNAGGDPVAFGLVESINRPGGNATGVANITTGLGSKRFDLLRAVVPSADRIAFLINPGTAGELREVEAAARLSGCTLIIVKSASEGELETAFADLTQQGARALLVGSDPFFIGQHKKLIALAARHAIPAIYQFRDFAIAGGLMSYGTKRNEAYRQAGIYTARVLQGANPRDLPVVVPTRYELVLNLNTAKMLGLELPATLLAIADEVIE